MIWKIDRDRIVRGIALAWVRATYQGNSPSMKMQGRAAQKGFLEGVRFMENSKCNNCNANIGCISHCSEAECFGERPEDKVKSRFVTPEEHNNGLRQACLSMIDNNPDRRCLLDEKHDGDHEENLTYKDKP